MTTFDIDEIERLLAAAEEDLIWEDQVLRKLDLAHAVMDHFPAMIAELRELRAENARLLEYSEYRHFLPVIERAKEACRNSGQDVADHFEDVLDMVDIGSGAKRQVADVRLAVDAALDMLDTLTDRLIAAAQAEARHKARTAVLLERDARHAAEMRELKERFGLAALLVDGDLEALGFAKTSPTRSRLAPFIIPDPLVEALQQAYDAAVAELGEDYVRKLSWFPSARKIGEAGE